MINGEKLWLNIADIAETSSETEQCSARNAENRWRPQERLRVVLWDQYCAHEVEVKNRLQNTFLPFANQRLIFRVNDPNLAAGQTFDQSHYSGYEGWREIEDYEQYMEFLTEESRPVTDYQKLLFYPGEDSGEEYTKKDFQPYPRKGEESVTGEVEVVSNDDNVIYECTRYHYMQMRSPKWLALAGDGYVPATRAEIIIPPANGEPYMYVDLNIQENSAGYYLLQMMGYHMKDSFLNYYGVYNAELVYLEWDPDEDVFSMFWDTSGGRPSEIQWGTIFQRVSMEQVMYGARMVDSTDAIEMIFIDRQWRSVLDGPCTIVELNESIPVRLAYGGLAKLKEVNGEWYVEATGDRVEISNGTLLTDDNSIRSSVIGQRFISAYNAYAAQEGLSTKEQADQTGGSQSDGMSPLIPQGDTEGY